MIRVRCSIMVQANMQALDPLSLDTLAGTLQGEWEHIGPLNVLGTDLEQREGMGRVNCIAFADGVTWYVGTAAGGLWRTDVAGFYLGGDVYPWYPLTDDLPTMAISESKYIRLTRMMSLY